ncbi:SLBB domain-containing protein [Odoribacter lunatus]|uniref:SLBB domain-containing protein n=1 Tax=Odoribacter lunatus TaxID=2941335 RepID=UPI0020413536|nr:SLBB domain-containing protein [Odoribacter lunatus]
MKRIALLVFLVLCGILRVLAQMSDEQVIKLLKDAQKQGMSQQQMILMLTQKGVTKEQIMRLKASYENGELGGANATSQPTDSRLRTTTKQNQTTKNNTDKTTATSKKTSDTEKEKTPKELMDKRFLKQQPEVDPMDMLNFEEDTGVDLLDSLTMEMEVNERLLKLLKQRENQIFGRDVFNNNLLTFEPQLNIATPDNYVLGPGDEVIIDVWGASQNNIRQVISPDGNIIIEEYGPLHLAGLTAKAANARVKNELSKIYSGISSGNTEIALTLGNIRSIQVNVMGEVLMPGTYTLPSLASAFHALYSAGGVNPIGSLRSMKIYRNGQEVADGDIYSYLLKGRTEVNMMLQDGDVIVVEPYQNQVKIEGKVKRPMIYELKDDEKISDLLNYSGGFTGDAYKRNIRIIRKSGRERQVYNVDAKKYDTFILTDGDLVTVDSVLERFENKVEVRGSVYREGLYALDEELSTVADLIDKADGLRGDAFPNRAVIYREKPDFSMEVIPVDMAGIMAGTTNVELKKNDVVYIPSIFELQEEYTISVKGEVGYPGVYKYVDNMTLEDLVIQSGGLLESASTVRVDVARRIKDPKSLQMGDQRAETYTFTLKDGLIVGGPSDFTLKPFDEVYIRRSPGYQEQQNISVEGEIMFAGEYALAKKGERLSDMIKRAGGLTPEAYPEGARLMRKMTDEEKNLIQQTLKKLAQQQAGNDTINVSMMELDEFYSVGIELDNALKKPGSDYDIILKEGDRLIVPEYNGTVRISGGVMYPNTVVYKPKVKSSYYISQAGGYAQRARKSRAFIIYMNGTVAVARRGKLDVKPGSEIIVPMKQQRRGFGLAEILSLATSTTSMAAMVTSIINSSK